jgi:O-antigen/teichoic acid export membrane protein
MVQSGDEVPAPAIKPEMDVLDTSAAGGLVIRGAAFRVLGFAAGTVLAVASAVLLTRHLGVSRFGQYTTVISVVTVAGALTDLGVTSLATREYAVRAGDEREHLLRDVLGLRIAITLLAVLLATAFAFAAGYDSERILGTILAGIGIGLVSVQVTVAVPLSAMLRLGQTSALELMRQAVWVGLLAILVLLGAGLLPLLAATAPAGLIALAVTARLVRKQMPMRPTLRPAVWAGLLRDTVTFSLATGVGAMYVFATQILTSLATSATQNGLFAASFRVFIVAASVAGLVVSAAFPVLARAARDDHERLRFAVQRLFEVMLILGVAAGLSAVTGARPIIEVVAGPHYAGAVEPLRIEGAALLASFLLPVWGLALISLHRSRALVIANLIALSTTVTLTLILASSHGATGAAVATVAGEWVISVAYVVALSRGESKLRLNPAVAVKVLLAAAPAFAVMLLGLPDVAQLTLALAIYALGILLLRAVPHELYGPLSLRWERPR